MIPLHLKNRHDFSVGLYCICLCGVQAWIHTPGIKYPHHAKPLGLDNFEVSRNLLKTGRKQSQAHI